MAGLLAFIHERTFVFLFNVLILFMFLSVVFIARKKRFTYVVITGIWAVIGIINGIVLNGRKTPFTAVDLTLVKSILPILNSYLELWQIVLIVILLIVAVIAGVCLYLYSPASRKSFDVKANTCLVLVMLLLFGGITYVGVGKGQLISKFDNLIAGYEDYGVVYGFCVTAFDTGIDRPIDYSREQVEKLRKKMTKGINEKKQQEKGEIARKPNIIFLQLESFFDPTKIKGLEFSEDPIPCFHEVQNNYTSGRVRVPVYGAGTVSYTHLTLPTKLEV